MLVLLRDYLDDGKVCLLTLNRPEVMNAFNTELGAALLETVNDVSEEAKVRVIVITGTGDRAFSAGGDLKERKNMSEDQWQRQHRIFEEAHRVVRNCIKPVICAVNGVAMGGGCELALSGDFVYASMNARFGFPEVTRGIIPGVGGPQLVEKYLSKGIALEMLMTGSSVDAERAYSLGMINKLTPPSELMEAAIDAARLIAKNSPLAVRMVKKSFLLGSSMSMEDAIQFSLECYNRTVSHPDRTEGVLAFNEQRDARFQDLY